MPRITILNNSYSVFPVGNTLANQPTGYCFVTVIEVKCYSYDLDFLKHPNGENLVFRGFLPLACSDEDLGIKDAVESVCTDQIYFN